MHELKKSLLADLKQILWALFLVYLILAVMGYLFGRQVGYRDVFSVCLGIAALVTTAFACLYLLNLVWITIERKREISHQASKKTV